jgi:hypothetical protein
MTNLLKNLNDEGKCPITTGLRNSFSQASSYSPADIGFFCKQPFFAVLNVTVKTRALFY